MGGESHSANNGLGCGTVLFFIFLTLKLTHYINWSWWWVTAPLWLPVILIVGILIFAASVPLFRTRD